MLTVKEAQALLLAELQPADLATQTLPLSASIGNYLAADVVAKLSFPPADTSAMDGYAIRSSDVRTTAPQPPPLKVTQRIAAGYCGEPLTPGSAARIFTGAPIPDGADSVVMQEECDEAKDGTLHCPANVPEGQHIRYQGEDLRAGSTVLTQGQCLDAGAIAMLSGLGFTEITCRQPLKVALFSTGDELQELGKPLKPGQIYNSNRYMLQALCQQSGFSVVDCGVITDTLAATRSTLRQAAAQADCIISTGGVSVGEADYVKEALEAEGSLKMWKIKMKPGKPLVFGKLGHTAFFGLPGNPASSFVCWYVMVLPCLKKLQGAQPHITQQLPAIAKFNKRANKTRVEYLRIQLHYQEGQPPDAYLHPQQGSGGLASLSWCNALAIVSPGEDVSKGDEIAVMQLAN